MDLKQLYTNIATYHSNEALVRETADQIILDFERYGIEINFPENLHFAYDELYDQLLPELNQLLAANNEKIMAMLYAIDVSEALINKEANEHPTKNLPEVITHLILEREFKKVLTRYYFRSISDNNTLKA